MVAKLVGVIGRAPAKLVDGARHAEGPQESIAIEADAVVSAFGMRPPTDVADVIDAKHHTKTRKIGDLFKLGKIGTAVREGYYAASALG